MPRRATAVLGFVALLLITDCATRYRPKYWMGGYSHVQLQETLFKVTFSGNGYTSAETVGIYCMYRCAEITIEEGYDYFIIQQSEDRETTDFAYMGYGYVSSVKKPVAELTIRLQKGEVPEDNPAAIDARELMRLNEEKIKRLLEG